MDNGIEANTMPLSAKRQVSQDQDLLCKRNSRHYHKSPGAFLSLANDDTDYNVLIHNHTLHHTESLSPPLHPSVDSYSRYK